MITRITIDVHHDQLSGFHNRAFDTYVSAETLKLPGLEAYSVLTEVLQSGAAEVKLEVLP